MKRAANGRLRSVIRDAADDQGLSLADLTVLEAKRDPYRMDTPAGHRNAAWFAKQVERFLAEGQTIHLRGLFYRVVAAADVRKPDRTRFINTQKDWEWFADEAGKAARWLGYVAFDRIVDERNAAPELFLPEPAAAIAEWSVHPGDGAELPNLDDALPSVWLQGFGADQPYRIILVGEKTSLAAELRAVAEDIGGELLLPSGELSDTLIAGIARRAVEDGRPAVVFYFSDFDPAGRQMPISLSRKLQALRDLEYPGLDVEVHAVALTLDQVRELDLPSTPLKDTEPRAEAWRAAMGHEQTEIDALLALHPGMVDQLAREAVAPFWDEAFAARLAATRQALEQEAQRRLMAHPAYAAARDEIEAALDEANDAVGALHEAQERAAEALLAVDLPDFAVPITEPGGLPPEPLFSTDEAFAVATLRLITYRALESGGVS
jgi:hypothetical protein